MAAKKFKMAAKKFQNEFQGVKKFYIKKQKPLRFPNFMSRPGIRKKRFKIAAKKFKMAAKKFKNEFHGVKKNLYKKRRPLCFCNFMSRPGIRKKN